jgi:CheY-like chemotaxis protein
MSSSGETAADRPVVLIVEDEVDALDVLGIVLEEAGYEVLRATNGVEALGQLGDRRGRCSLILLDLMMPVMNGWDFRRKQREIPAFASIPVVLMSAGARLANAANELDPVGYVNKPVEVSDLLDTVRRLCP